MSGLSVSADGVPVGTLEVRKGRWKFVYAAGWEDGEELQMKVLDDGSRAPLPLRERGEYACSSTTFICTRGEGLVCTACGKY